MLDLDGSIDEAAGGGDEGALLERYHPQIALAIDCGVKMRPCTRVIQVPFATNTANATQSGAMNVALGDFALFVDVDYTIDPTNAFGGSSLKTLSDRMQAEVSGILTTLRVVQGDIDYNPIAQQIPIQLVPRALRKARWRWLWRSPQAATMDMQIQTPIQGQGPLTVWFYFSFMCPDAGALDEYMRCSSDQARQELASRRAVRREQARRDVVQCLGPPAT